MSNTTPIPSQSEVKKMVLYNQNADGSLSPSSLVPNTSGAVPILNLSDVQKAVVYTLNADGTLSPVTI